MKKPTEIIEQFYSDFKNLDAETMVACYHKDIVFKDPAFGVLKGDKAKNMWRMLCHSQKDKDFVINYSDIKFSDGKGSAQWEAHYTFSKTGRKVHNKIMAAFEFKDGLIIKHTDSFNLYRWAQQAFGLTGYLIGWTSFFRKKLQVQTNTMLSKFEK
jgi:ketosteroid isomerase-like protein